MIHRLMGDRIEIERSEITGRDRLNNPVRSVVSTTRTIARMVQDTTQEADDSDVVIDRWRLYAPSDTDLRATDVVIYNGTRFLVDGTPKYENVPGFPAANHVSASLRRIEALS